MENLKKILISTCLLFTCTILKSSPEGYAPEFLHYPRDITCSNGMPAVTFSMAVKASPEPFRRTLINGAVIDYAATITVGGQQVRKYAANKEGNYYEFTVRGCYTEDTGIYTFMFWNEYGVNQKSARLTVMESIQ